MNYNKGSGLKPLQIRDARFLCVTFYDESSPAHYDLRAVDLVYFTKKLTARFLLKSQKKEIGQPDIYQLVIDICNEISEFAEMRFIDYREIGTAMREEKDGEKRWGCHGFSIFFPQYDFEFEFYKNNEGWYFDTSPETACHSLKKISGKTF